MNKRRRIEITVFRRRTTIVLHDHLAGGPIEPPPGQGDAWHPAPADSPQEEEADLNQRHAPQPPPGSLVVTKLRKRETSEGGQL